MIKITILIGLICFFIGAIAVRTESYFALNNFTDICYFVMSFFILFSIVSIILFIIEQKEQKDHALKLKDRQSFQIFTGTLISIFIIIVLGYIHIKTNIIDIM